MWVSLWYKKLSIRPLTVIQLKSVCKRDQLCQGRPLSSWCVRRQTAQWSHNVGNGQVLRNTPSFT